MTCVLGVDPGVSGAIAFYFPEVPDRISVEDVPVAFGEINTPALASIVRNFQPSYAFMERVSAMVGWGASPTFKFGVSFGDVRGVIGALNIPLHFVTPPKWKKHFNLTADKEQSRALAIRMFPSCAHHFNLKRHHGRAEAALIALYGAAHQQRVAA